MATLDTILNIKVEGTSQMTQLKTAIDETSKQLKDLKKNGKEAGQTQAQFNAKVVEGETKIKGLRGELNKQKNDLIKNAKALGDNSKSYDSLTKQNAKLSAEMRKLGDPLGKNKAKFQELTGKIKKNTEQLKTMDSAMGRSQRNVGNYGASIGKMATAIGGAILVLQQIKRAISSFVDFEFAIKQVAIISGATTAELESLSESAKELGRTTSFTAGEVAGLQKELAKLGFDPTEINNMTSSVLDLAFAFDIDLATASEKVGGVLKSFNLDSSETTRVTDVLATAFANSALDMDKFATAFPKVGAVANVVGFSLEDVTALMGTLADKSLDASVMGTSLRNIFLKMADPTSSLSKALDGSVTSVEQLIPALIELKAKGTDMTAMLELTDTRSVTAFASLLNGTSTIDTLNEKLLNASGTTEKFGKEMRDTLKGSIDEAMSSANGFAIELIESLEPAITLLTDGIGLLFAGLTFLVENFRKIGVALVAYQAGVYLSTISTATLTTALSASSIATALQTAKTWLATYAQRAWNLALKMNPLGLLLGGIATGVALLTDFGGATEESTEAMEENTEAMEENITELTKLEKIRKKNSDKLNKELAQLATYRQSIKDTSLSTKERNQALEDYNKLAGTNISNLQSEKDILAELEKSYDDVVNSIRRRIAITSAEEEITQLIIEQNEGANERVEANQKVETALLSLEEINKKISLAEEQRLKLGFRNTAEMLADEQFRANESADIRTKREKLNQEMQSEFYEMGQTFAEDDSGWHEAMLERNLATTIDFNNHELSALREKEMIEKNARDKETFENENRILENDELLISNQEVFELLKEQRVLEEQVGGEYSTLMLKKKVLDSEYANQQEEIDAILKKRNDTLDSLIIDESVFGEEQEKTIDGLKIYKDSLKKLELNLSNLIVAQEAEKNAFINSKKAKAMTTKQVDDEIVRIETKTAQKIIKATNAVIKAKAELDGVEAKLLETFEQFDDVGETNVKTMAQISAEGEAKIAIDQAQIDSMEELAKVNEEVAKRQIQLSLKVAKAELDLFLQTLSLYEDKTDENQKYIEGLITNINLFQSQLNEMDDDGGGGGFLQKSLFGTDDDDNPLTGEQLIEGLNVTFDAVSGMLDSFSSLQHERLNSQVSAIETAKSKEIDAFKETAEYEIMTDDQKATAIEDIEKKHDAEMLALKVEQWKKDKSLAITQALMGGAQSIMNILAGKATGNVILDSIIKGILIGSTIAMTALQIATIKSQAPPTAELGGVMDDSFFARGGMVHGRSHKQGGEKFAVGGRVAELEGGEAVINKRSTSMFKPMLSKINQAGGGRKFADGGMVFDVDSIGGDVGLAESIIGALNAQEVLLVEAEVTQSQKTVKNIESRITF